MSCMISSQKGNVVPSFNHAYMCLYHRPFSTHFLCFFHVTSDWSIACPTGPCPKPCDSENVGPTRESYRTSEAHLRTPRHHRQFLPLLLTTPRYPSTNPSTMRASLHRLATHTTRSRSITSRPPALALLPPIQLYRRVLRCHRKFLPVDKRLLGDEFVKSEFRRHKDIDNPVHIVGFLTEWQSYVKQLEDGNWMQGNLDMEKLEKMSGKLRL